MALRIVIFHNYVGLPEGNMIRLLNIGLYCEYIEGLDALWYGCNFLDGTCKSGYPNHCYNWMAILPNF